MRIIWLLILLPFFSTAQSVAIDSIQDLIRSSEDKNEQSLQYAKLAKAYVLSNMDSAVFYAKKGFELSKSNSYELGQGENLAALGYSYVRMDQLETAKTYYEQAKEFFNDDEHLKTSTQISMILGNINLAQNQFVEALELYQDCLNISKEQNFIEYLPHLYNNLGNLYLQIDDYDDATENYIQASRLFKEIGDEYDAAVAMSNISNIQNILGNTDAALKGYLDAIRIFSEKENWADMARAYTLITRIYLQKNEYDKAQEYLKLGLNLLENSNFEYNGPLSIYQTDIYTTAAQFYYLKEEFAQAKIYGLKALELAKANSYTENIFENARVLSSIYEKNRAIDSALYYNKIYIESNEAYQNENDLKRITQLKMQYEFDEILKKKEIDEIKKQADYKRKELLYSGVLIVGLLSLIITVLLFLNQKAKTAKIILKKENLELEKEKLNQEIDYKKKELASNMMYLVEKNEFLTKIARQLVDLKPSSKKDNQSVIQGLINELKVNSNDKVWDEFELRFKEVHSDFYDALSGAFPDLTPNEIKICAFLRLNMSTKEISSITHQSVKSINMARFRLRKKLDIDRDENLIAFLTQL